MSNKKVIIELRGEHPIFNFIMPFILLLYILIWIAFFIKYGLIIRILLIALLILNIRFILKRKILKVKFFNDEVTVHYFFGRKYNYEYNMIKFFRENKEGFLPITVINGFLKNNGKFYFYCPQSKKVKLDNFLKSKSFRIRHQE